MKVLINPSENELNGALNRPELESVNLNFLISEVFSKVGTQKDEALKSLTLQFFQPT